MTDRHPGPVVLFLVYSFQIGGSERLASNLALALKAKGIRVVVASLSDSDGPIRKRLRSEGIETIGLGWSRGGAYARIVVPLRLFSYIVRLRPVAVHCQHFLTLIHAIGPARAAGIRNIIVTEHSDEALRRLPNYRRRAAAAGRRATTVTAIHDLLGQYLVREVGVRKESLRIIRNGVVMPAAKDRSAREAVREQFGRDPDEFMFLSVGRLHEDKDFASLLRAVAAAKRRSAQRFWTVVVGDGDEREMLLELRRKLGLDDWVTFALERLDVERFLSAADCFLMTSKTEGVPLALLEAMSFGLPCISTEVGGIGGVLRDGAGVLVGPGDTEEIGRKMLQVLTDDGLRRRLAEAALFRAGDEMSFSRMTDAYANLYESTVSRGS